MFIRGNVSNCLLSFWTVLSQQKQVSSPSSHPRTAGIQAFSHSGKSDGGKQDFAQQLVRCCDLPVSPCGTMESLNSKENPTVQSVLLLIMLYVHWTVHKISRVFASKRGSLVFPSFTVPLPVCVLRSCWHVSCPHPPLLTVAHWGSCTLPVSSSPLKAMLNVTWNMSPAVDLKG